MKPNYFNNIHVLRAFAALSVVMYHIIEIMPWKDFPWQPAPLLWFRVGWMGVDLFFVISGFVISLSAIRLLRAAEHPLVTTYLRHRAARVMPLYFLTGAIFLILTPELLRSGQLWFHLVTHSLFIHNWFPQTHGSINGPNWSIGAEFQFYLLILLTVRWLARANPWLILGTFITIAWIWRAGVFLLFSGSAGGANIMFIYSTQLFGTLDLFGAGIFLSRVVLDPIPLPLWATSKRLGFLVSSRGTLWLIFAAITSWIAWAVFWPRAEYWQFWGMVVFWPTLATLAFFGMVGAAVFVQMPTFVDRYLMPPIHYLGEISYGIYLWHLPIILSVKKMGITQPVLFTVVTLSGVLICAAVSWHFVERPLIRRYR